MESQAKGIPVILDTDIGDDIDDTWALALLLRCPELDVRLIVSSTGNTEYRAAIIARMLEVEGRTDIPVGIGIKQSSSQGRQAPWVASYKLDSYPGIIRRDGISAIIETVEKSPVPLTLICIGPLSNIAEVLRRAPHVAGKTRLVGMLGSIRRRRAEYNVRRDIKSCQDVFRAPWLKVTITPQDTCGRVRISGPEYATVAGSRDPLAMAVIENYRIWLNGESDTESSILFDTVAVHLAHSNEFLDIKKMRLRITDEGFTVKDRHGTWANVALSWVSLDAFGKKLVERLTSEGQAGQLKEYKNRRC